MWLRIITEGRAKQYINLDRADQIIIKGDNLKIIIGKRTYTIRRDKVNLINPPELVDGQEPETEKELQARILKNEDLEKEANEKFKARVIPIKRYLAGFIESFPSPLAFLPGELQIDEYDIPDDGESKND